MKDDLWGRVSAMFHYFQHFFEEGGSTTIIFLLFIFQNVFSDAVAKTDKRNSKLISTLLTSLLRQILKLLWRSFSYFLKTVILGLYYII